jgi:hypothetical protein
MKPEECTCKGGAGNTQSKLVWLPCPKCKTPAAAPATVAQVGKATVKK